MPTTTMKELLRPADFVNCPVWRYDEDLEGYFEVRDQDDLDAVGSTADLQIMVEFTTQTGQRLMGKIVGVNDIYAIGLFVRDEVVGINKNMREDSRKQVAKFLALSGLAGQLSLETLFPLRFETKWGGAMFNDFSGVFEVSL